jgi:hypothetical protein
MSYENDFIFYLKTKTKVNMSRYEDEFREQRRREREEAWDYYEEPNRFELTKDHIKLLKNMLVGWSSCETGAPEINPKRPYGDSYVARSVGEILKIKPEGYEDEPDTYSEEQEDMLLRLHRQTETALQIVLQMKSFKPGRFVRESFCDWKRLK